MTPVLLLHAWAQSSGTIEAESFRMLKQELLERLSAALPVDGVVLCLHGAGVVEGTPDLAADLARTSACWQECAGGRGV